MVVSALLVGCTNTGRNQAAPPAAAVATTDPFVLSGVAYTQGDVQAQRNTVPAPPPNADIVATPAGAPPSPVVTAAPLPPTGAPPATVVGAAPLTPAGLTAAAPVAAAPPATPSSAATPGAPAAVPPVDTAGFPNINLPPKQPSGQLLTPDEREKLIQELNALAGQ